MTNHHGSRARPPTALSMVDRAKNGGEGSTARVSAVAATGLVEVDGGEEGRRGAEGGVVCQHSLELWTRRRRRLRWSRWRAMGGGRGVIHSHSPP